MAPKGTKGTKRTAAVAHVEVELPEAKKLKERFAKCESGASRIIEQPYGHLVLYGMFTPSYIYISLYI